MSTAKSIIQAAVLFGNGHEHTGILLEPVEGVSVDIHDLKQVVDFQNRVWPIIEEEYRNTPAFCKIRKEMILITSPNKPLPRSAKGTVIMDAALKLYQTVELNTTREQIRVPDSWEKNALQAWLLQQARDIQCNDYLDSSRNIFEQGFDSLSATFLHLRIIGAIKKAHKGPNPVQLKNIVNSHPIIEDLADYLASVVLDSESDKEARSPKDVIEDMIAKYSVGLEKPLERSLSTSERPVENVVLITGATGSLGSQILEQLLRHNGVARIYALNRPGSSPVRSRLQRRFIDKGLDTQLLDLPKLVLLEGDLVLENFGLLMEVYTQMQNAITVVIHVAWKLNFNSALSSFETNIQGTRKLIEFVRESPYALFTRFLYTSSISSAQAWSARRGPYPEEVVHDSRYAVGWGYGESKYVTERILANSGLRTTSIRISQISGGRPSGAWAVSDWFPILIKSSLTLGILPDSPGVISWLLMEATAQSILELAFCPEMPPIAINLVHPRPIRWTLMISRIRQVIVHTLDIEEDSLVVVPLSEWVSCLEKQAKNTDNPDILSNVPAIKLLSFFRTVLHRNNKVLASGLDSVESGGFTLFATDKAQHFCPTLRKLDELSIADIQLWINYWRDVGFIDV